MVGMNYQGSKTEGTTHLTGARKTEPSAHKLKKDERGKAVQNGRCWESGHGCF